MRVYFQTFVDEQIYCCDKPMEVRGVYDVETKNQSLIFKCRYCMTATKINTLKNKKDMQMK